jgi:putative membrane protein
MPSAYIPYCGQAPLPDGAVWNLDPLLITALLVWLLTSLSAMQARQAGRRTAFAAGWLVAAIALISPLCNLSVALFSARISQHMILTLVAAPLVAYGYFGVGKTRRTWGGATSAVASFAFLLWVWHAPIAYDATFTSDAVYWLMHVSLFTSATLVWRVLLSTQNLAITLFASVATGAQMSALGALLALTSHALYAVHALTTGPWGLSPLSDQQLGGLIMWIPGGLILTAHALWALSLKMGAPASDRMADIYAVEQADPAHATGCGFRRSRPCIPIRSRPPIPI